MLHVAPYLIIQEALDVVLISTGTVPLHFTLSPPLMTTN